MTYKEIPGFEGKYSVDRAGNIISKMNRTLKPWTDRDGYHTYRLFISSGKYKKISGHRAVALAWLDNTNNYPVINHINEIKTDNRVENLEWCTIKHNNWHSKESQLGYKLDYDKANEIRKLYESGGISHYKIAKLYNVAPNSIMQILHKKTYTL